MSYDIWLTTTVDTGAPEPLSITVVEVGNMTSNVSGMWRKALGHSLGDLDGRTAGDCTAALEQAVTAMDQDPEPYMAMEPANGWGSYDGALRYLRTLATGCAEHPKTVIRISR
jgi:hypothetical protein